MSESVVSKLCQIVVSGVRFVACGVRDSVGMAVFRVLFIELSLYETGAPKNEKNRSASIRAGLAGRDWNFAQLCRKTQIIHFLHIYPSYSSAR
jgi:hypothetical protein